MKFNKERLNKPWAAYTFAICCGVVLYVVLSHINLLGVGISKLYHYIQPVFIGLVIAYILNPLAKLIYRSISKLEKKKVPQKNANDTPEDIKAQQLHAERKRRVYWRISVAVTIILVLVLFVVLLVMLIPQVVDSIVGLISNIGTYVKNINSLLSDLNDAASKANIDITGITSFVQNAIDQIGSTLSKNSGNIVTTVTDIGTSIFNAVISFIISIYFLLDKFRLKHACGRLARLVISEKRYPQVSGFWGRCNRIMIRYIGSDIIDGVIVGCANAIFQLIAGMPYVALISVVVGITNLAPTFGPIVGAVIGAFILVLNNPWYALWFLIFTLILQTCDGYVIKPKLFGDTLGVPSIWILISIIVFGRMWGVAGILLAIPIAAITDFIYHDYILKKLEERRKGRHEKASSSVKDKETITEEAGSDDC